MQINIRQYQKYQNHIESSGEISCNSCHKIRGLQYRTKKQFIDFTPIHGFPPYRHIKVSLETETIFDSRRLPRGSLLHFISSPKEYPSTSPSKTSKDGFQKLIITCDCSIISYNRTIISCDSSLKTYDLVLDRVPKENRNHSGKLYLQKRTIIPRTFINFATYCVIIINITK